jgi:hypothetical protein
MVVCRCGFKTFTSSGPLVDEGVKVTSYPSAFRRPICQAQCIRSPPAGWSSLGGHKWGTLGGRRGHSALGFSFGASCECTQSVSQKGNAMNSIRNRWLRWMSAALATALISSWSVAATTSQGPAAQATLDALTRAHAAVVGCRSPLQKVPVLPRLWQRTLRIRRSHWPGRFDPDHRLPDAGSRHHPDHHPRQQEPAGPGRCV